MHQEELQDAFFHAMRRLAATVCVITCRDSDERRYGMTATAVTSLSLTPVSLLVCVNRSSDFYQRLTRADAFCVNVLSETQAEQCRVFGSRRHLDERFKVGSWSDDPYGPPVLADAQANLICAPDASFDYGTHSIVIGRVRRVLLGNAVAPLIYLDRKMIAAHAMGTGPAQP
jgi:flavin reductase (DIM6/NTAB) family NADH-FMN oxidoreductase RutF